MKKSKVFLVLLMCLCCFVTSFSLTAFAAEDNDITYSFKMKANQTNSYYSEERYRGTENTQNAWKVNMVFSSEGKGTVAMYFIASDFWKTQYSNAYEVKQGSGPHYYAAYAKASKEYVVLGCMNNNYVPKSFDVSGYWDEETGKKPGYENQ